MSQINDVNIRSIPDNFIMSTPKWLTEPPTAMPIYPPVTDVIGIPIVDVQGVWSRTGTVQKTYH